MSEALQQGTLLACSDGSYDPITQSAAYGMVFGMATGPILQGSSPCSGHPSQFSAIWLDLSSINASVGFIFNLCLSLNITNGSLTLYNDCSKAQKVLNSSSRKFKRFLQDDYDIIYETQTLIQKIKTYITFSLVWVKGHYSGKKEVQHLMNDQAHDIAVAALREPHNKLSEVPPPSSLITV
jgi:hypothetical protein